MHGFGFGPGQAARRRPGGPAATPLPRSANIIAAWSADDIAPQADNTPLDAWVEPVNGLVMGGSGSTRPRYRTDAMNGKAGVEWVAANGHKLVLPRANAGPINAATSARRYSSLTVYRSTGTSAAGMLFSTGLGDSLISLVGDGTHVGRVGTTLMFVPHGGQGAITTLGYSSTDVPANPNATGLERFYVNGGCVGMQGVPGPQGGTADYAMGNDASGAFPNNAILSRQYVWDCELTPPEFLQAEKAVRERLSLPDPWAGQSSFLVYQGNSITANTDADFPNHGYPAYASAQLGLSFGQWSNLAIGAETITTQDARAVHEVDPIAAVTGIPTRLAFFEFFNQVTIGGSTGTQAAAIMGSYLANRRSAGIDKIVVGTCLDSGGASTQDSARAQKASFVTGMLGLSPSLYDALVRLDLNADIGVDGAWSNGTYFAADGYHLFGRAGTPNGMSVLGVLMGTALAGI